MALLDSITEEEAKDLIYRQIRPEIRRMAMNMEQKFALHDRDRGNPFRCIDFDFMRTRIRQESEEMYDAMKAGKNPNEIWREAADRCNIITMEAVAYEYEWKVIHQKKEHEIREMEDVR